MRCPLCKQDCTNGHVCSTVLATSTEERVERLEVLYESLKGEVVKVYGVAGGKPGDTPAQAVQRAIRAAKVALLGEVIGVVKTSILVAQKSKSKAVAAAADTRYLEGWGDGLGGVLDVLEDMLRELEAIDG